MSTHTKKKYISKRQQDQEKDKTSHGHDIHHWCGKCLNFEEVDLSSEGLGRGHIISNL